MLHATPGARPGLQYLDWFRTMREDSPISHDPSTGYWNVFRYDDAVGVMHDFHTYSSQRPGAGMFEGDIINLDPPRHDQLRGIVSQVFTPRAIAQLEPRIRAITQELLAHTDGRAELELIDDLAFPLPVTVIAEMLGVPAEDRPLFRQWSNELHRMTDVDLTTDAARDEAAQIMGQFQNYLRDHVRDRRVQPRDDLL